MSHWLYQGQTEPVLVTAAPAVSIDSWFSEWRTPVSRVFATALISIATVVAPTQPEASSVDKWFAHLSSPLRAKDGLDASRQSVLAWSAFTPARTDIGWFSPFSDPSRLDKPRAASFPLSTSDTKPIVSFGWFEDLSIPVRKVPRTTDFRFSTTDTRPTVSFGWFADLSLPPKPKDGLRASLQRVLEFDPYPVTPVFPTFSWFRQFDTPVYQPKRATDFPFVTADFKIPVPSMASWYGWLGSPVRVKVGLYAQYHPALAFDPYPIQNVAPPSAWFNWYSEPVRQLRGLQTAYQRDLFFDPYPRPNPVPELIPAWISGPVMFRQFHVSLQQAYTAPTRHLPTPDVTVTLSATETNADTFEAGIILAGRPVRAVVSIEEVPPDRAVLGMWEDD